eukprot:CAMPEP_0174358960 /NCGR_PEP_ID=MMETSP0811_2-20130205/45641_1 /TAXON_ID=73025 ORGANISM="Eutreptiella gymnastica-like, Strain CCMP1594" /NCGR_SAMPLE_ID=MMETSP0811_2 /ASSEMBLY_ACC=CAM_ASM_000667 /LENGTH=168 /DNA_ID=CAMNT_0015493181 /DNA_START=179 /DNA_END=682 /DNA_ORIENTATION=-
MRSNYSSASLRKTQQQRCPVEVQAPGAEDRANAINATELGTPTGLPPTYSKVSCSLRPFLPFQASMRALSAAHRGLRLMAAFTGAELSPTGGMFPSVQAQPRPPTGAGGLLGAREGRRSRGWCWLVFGQPRLSLSGSAVPSRLRATHPALLSSLLRTVRPEPGGSLAP